MPTEDTLGRSRPTECPFFLSTRQRQILSLAAQGLAYQAMARQLGLAACTVRDHLVRARKALGAANTTQAVAVALVWGLIDIDVILRHRRRDDPEAYGHKNRGAEAGFFS